MKQLKEKWYNFRQKHGKTALRIAIALFILHILWHVLAGGLIITVALKLFQNG